MGENYFDWRERVRSRAQELSNRSLDADNAISDSMLQDQYFNQDLSAEEAAEQLIKRTAHVK